MTRTVTGWSSGLGAQLVGTVNVGPSGLNVSSGAQGQGHPGQARGRPAASMTLGGELLKSKTETSPEQSLSRQNQFSGADEASLSLFCKANSLWVTSCLSFWKPYAALKLFPKVDRR